MPEETQNTPQSPRDGSGDMFDHIARRYDMVNRIISLNIDKGWRKRAAKALELSHNTYILDLATGTGDLAIEIAGYHENVSVIGLDPSLKMLDVARKKIERAQLQDQIELVKGDAQELPYENESFDGVSIAFGIRNVPDRAKALREMARVTKPHGRIVILELSEPTNRLVGPIAKFHIHTVVPYVGSLVSGDHEYHYLQKSIAAFPPAPDFAKLMEDSGLKVLEVHPLTFGVCHLYVAESMK